MFQAKRREWYRKVTGGYLILQSLFFLKFCSVLESHVLFLFLPLSSTSTTLLHATHPLSRTQTEHVIIGQD